MKLNSQQLLAVKIDKKPTYVISGAGTGKTRVIVSRICHLISHEKIDPERILVISFTRKSTKELIFRIKQKLKNEHEVKNVFTFNAFFKKIFEDHVDKFQPEWKNFKILSEEGRNWIIKKIIQDLRIRGKNRLPVGDIAYYMSEFKKIMGDQEALETRMSNLGKQYDVTKQEWEKIFDEYIGFLDANTLMEFVDFEIRIKEWLDESREVRDFLKTRFDAILIDEFQDTSRNHFEIIKKITNPDSNIFIVGDPDQRIYGFREIIGDSMEEFKKYFRNGEILKLEQNYRSVKEILDVSNKLISRNYESEKDMKKLWTERRKEGMVLYKKFSNTREEVSWVIDEIENLQESGVDLKDIAILYRNKYISKDFKEEIKNRDLNWRINDLTQKRNFFYKEMRFIIAVLYLVIKDGVSIHCMREIIDFVDDISGRYLGIKQRDIEIFYDWAMENNYSFSEAAENIEECTEKMKEYEIFEIFIKDILHLQNLKNMYIDSLMDEALRVMCEEKIEVQNISLRRIKMHINRLRKKYKKEKNEIIFKSLLAEQEEEPWKYSFEQQLNFSTIHSVKGLEYKYVFLVRVSDGILPSNMPDSTMEEERRLTYVAYTRAKDHLYITFAPDKKNPIESPFIEESRNSEFFMEEWE